MRRRANLLISGVCLITAHLLRANDIMGQHAFLIRVRMKKPLHLFFSEDLFHFIGKCSGGVASTGGVPTAVDKQSMAGDEIRGGTRQEKAGADQIRGLRKPSEFDPAEQPLRACFIFTE
jgi:hypothetical protein